MAQQSKRSKDRHIGIRLSPHLHLQVVEMAKKHGVSLSVVIRALLMRALGEIIDDKGYERESD